MKKLVYVVSAFYADFEESGYTEPSEKFYRDTLDEAEALKAELMNDPEYDEVIISDSMEEVEFL